MRTDNPADWMDKSCIGITASGKNSTDYRWENEIFKLMVISETDKNTTSELRLHPAHINGKKHDGSWINVCVSLGSMNMLNWLDLLVEKDYLNKTGSGKGTTAKFELTDDAQSVLNHLSEPKNHDYREGFCKVCHCAETWNDRARDVDTTVERLWHLVSQPNDNPIEEDKKELAESAISKDEIMKILHPKNGSFWAGSSKRIKNELDLPDTGLSDYKVRRLIDEKIDSLVESGELAEYPFANHAWYIHPNLNIRVRDGEIKTISLPEKDQSEENAEQTGESSLIQKFIGT